MRKLPPPLEMAWESRFPILVVSFALALLFYCFTGFNLGIAFLGFTISVVLNVAWISLVSWLSDLWDNL